MMNRQRIREQIYMNAAVDQAKLSTCRSTNVGAVIVLDNRIVTTGYNGVAAGMPHCNEYGDWLDDKTKHLEFADKTEIHAEMNALMNALDTGSKVRGGVCYTTVQPCWNCIKHLHRAGITEIFYKESYWRYTEDVVNEQQETFKIRVTKFKNDEEE
ncbi:hypothetical protein [Synechococcus phage BUCT-ZZ01]|nr:hypothetical protein [Synechococcus phage BUCT-ZZ01]